MKNFLIFYVLLTFFFVLASCSNTPELETGEIKTLQLLKNATKQANSPKIFVDARDLLSRRQIDLAAIPILFVEHNRDKTVHSHPIRKWCWTNMAWRGRSNCNARKGRS